MSLEHESMCMQLKNALEFSIIIIIIYRKQSPKKTLCGVEGNKKWELTWCTKNERLTEGDGPHVGQRKSTKKAHIEQGRESGGLHVPTNNQAANGDLKKIRENTNKIPRSSLSCPLPPAFNLYLLCFCYSCPFSFIMSNAPFGWITG